ncbi:putative Zn-dependent protease [Nakamurella flavida]|uniref:TldD/PmbA family protein n=1 Tax=Nakamurella flavida TaxID=363630 RepID=UPI002780536B|nr:TldD/PmbA family protein [Nakamurella flavida]MDP9778507.1 putative Zn-dependent protease [Nakamurella flavida]
MSTFAPPLDPARALEVAQRAVRDCPADAVEVTVLGRAGEYTRFAGDRIHQPQDITELTVSVKAIVNGHAARAATTSLDRVAETARAAADLARGRAAAAGAPGHATVGTPGPLPELSLWHEDTAAFDAGARVALAGRAMRGGAEVGGVAAGMIGRALTQIAVATSSGTAVHAEATEASGSLTVSVDGGTAHWVDLHRSSDALRAGDAIDAAVRRALAGRGRMPMPDGEFTVVLGPQAAGELLGFLPDVGFSGELAAAGVGVCTDPGARRASELITVGDDALAPVGLPIPFDFEGTPKQRVPFLQTGVVGRPVTDLATAAALGETVNGGRSTGHAHIAREEVPSPVAANIVMPAGPTPEADLIAGVERGVYVERFWYTRLVDRQASTITGVSRDACFLIEDGELAAPVDTGRFTQSVLGFLGSVDGVGDQVRSQPVMNVWNGSVSAPALRGSGFRFGNRPLPDGQDS